MLDVLCEIVRCPLTSSRLLRVERSELETLNAQIANGSMQHADGTPVDQPLSQALRTPDGRLTYRCDDGIPALLPHLALVDGREDGVIVEIDPAKRVVQEFYDEFGWLQEGEHYLDTLAFVDVRPLAMDYLQRCHRRVRRHLPSSGRFLLDAASGPVQYEEYRRLSNGFEFRVCVDLSALALREAQRNLGAHGLYVIGDMAHLPFRDCVFDAAVSIHTIYHVPAHEQRAAFEEVHRVLKVGAPGVIVYRWAAPRDRTRVGRLLPPVGRTASRVVKRLQRERIAEPEPLATPPLYSHSHTYEWFREQDWPFDADIRAWRSVGGPFLRGVRDAPTGRAFLRLLYCAEELAPHLAGRLGRFPMIVIRERPSDTP